MDSAPAAPLFGAGRFEVRGTLGAGGAGIVYRAYDRLLKREVALKWLRQASGRDLYRFKREFRALADIVHPNLVTLHELHASDGDWYFTMDVVEGMSFIDWVRPSISEAGPQRTRQNILATGANEVRLRGALVQLIDALIALHKAGKLHRDLKPSNVLVTQQGKLTLLDFGLVSNLAEDNPERLAVGTPVYMSPEQASDQQLTEASDWYSVGAMLYEALTGRRPFEGDSEKVMTQKQTDLPLDPRALVPTVPQDLARLCLLLLQPDPKNRPTGFAILDQLGATPSPRTRDMARSANPVSFVGRTRELDELRRALADARRQGVAVMLKGKSGMGKSALVRTFVRGLGDAVFSLEGRCFEREQISFKMLDGIVDVLTGVLLALPPADAEGVEPKELGSLVRLFPVMKRVKRFGELAAQSPPPADPSELRRRGFAALRQLLGKLARIRPLVIIVDDVHWGDADSAAFLNDLIHRPEPGMLMLFSHRPEDYLGLVARLRNPQGGARRGDVREVEIKQLDDAEATRLVAQLSSDPARVEQAVRSGGGNPLVLNELARAPVLAAGANVDDLVRARASRLSPEAQAMLAVSSVAAKPITVEIAAHAAGVDGGHEEAAELTTERLVTLRRVNGQTLIQPAHDHVKVAVLASLDIESRAGWHEALAKAYEHVQGEAQLDSQAVVEHWLAAGHPANAAHHAVPAAARAEEALAFRRAAELYDIALTYGPWDAAGQRDLMRKKATALAWAGQLDEAATIYGHAAQILPDDDAIDCERLRIEALLRRGRIDDALPIAAKLLAQIGIRSPFGASRTKLATQWMQQKLRGLDFVERRAEKLKPAELRRVDVLYSIVSGLAFVDPMIGRVLQGELLRAALECGEPVRVCLALAQEVCYAASAGSRNANAVAAVCTRLKALATRIGHAHMIGLADTAIGIAAYMGGNWTDARTHLEAGLTVLRDHGAGVRWEIDIGETYWLASLYYLGEWHELVRQGQVVLRDAIDRGDVVARLGASTGLANLAWLLTGKVDESRAQLTAAEAELPPGFHMPHVLALQAACNIELYAENARAAGERLDAAWSNIDRSGVLRVQHLRVELSLLRAQLALADVTRPADERARSVRAIGDELDKEGAGWAAGIGHCLRAAAMALRGDHESVAMTLSAAEDHLEAAGMRGWLQVARLRRGRVEGGPGGAARAAAAGDFLKDLGAANPEAIATLLVPWPA
jgi:tetratricopeptide (TPR) repeat protein/tRNA A-37 threonylcarbamoyl transferase component Bud32